ncbi:MAG: 3-dehydroquinate synthase family protein [Spirochaetales bacterium]
MVDEIRFTAGEFSTRIRFYHQPQDLLEGAQLAVFDENTRSLVPGYTGPDLVWPAGEAHKTWPQIDALLARALGLALARDSLLAGVGGGVVTDMAAFAASLFMRGCRLVLVPTTLLAMVDASLGGKTGIDYHGFKNLVGTFYPAQELRIWPGFLQTLPERDYRSGLAEVIKHAMLGEPGLWELLSKSHEAILAREPAVLNELVYRAIMVKVGVVERDLREAGERAFLNLGHTFGHALESVMTFDGTWTHGEAVCWGIARALDLGVGLGRTDKAWQAEVLAMLGAYGFRLTAAGAVPSALLAAMKNDKKKKDGLVRFVLQEAMGKTFQQPVPDDDVLACLARGV